MFLSSFIVSKINGIQSNYRLGAFYIYLECGDSFRFVLFLKKLFKIVISAILIKCLFADSDDAEVYNGKVITRFFYEKV